MADDDPKSQRNRDFERALGLPASKMTASVDDDGLESTGLVKSQRNVFESAKRFMAKSGAAVKSMKDKRSAPQPTSHEVAAVGPSTDTAPASATAAAVAAAAAAAQRARQEPVAAIATNAVRGSAGTVIFPKPAAMAAARPRRDRGVYGFFGPGIETFFGLTAALITLFASGWVVKDWLSSRTLDKSGLQRVVAKKWNDRTLVFPIEGTDADGRRALFDVVILTKDYGWVKGSTTELERGEKRLSADDIEQDVLAPQLREGLGNARALIAVGLASQEGEVEREEQRGGLRAARIASWVRGVVDPNIPMWTLNLGRYLEPCAECEDGDTSWQRPFIVIANRQAGPGTNISEALKSAMSDKVNLPSPSRYSAWALAKFAN